MEEYSSNLLFRRQFFYGPEPLAIQSWRSIPMPGGQVLSTHPELDVTQAVRAGFELTLLGFMLDPDHPDDGNAQILERLMSPGGSLADLVESTEPLAGRWVLIAVKGDQAIALNDAGGVRPIYYHIDKQGRVWLGSQPGLFAHKFGFQYSEDARRYLQSPGYTRRVEAWWPGDSTAFAEVRHLLPNHWIDLHSGVVRRFWPNKPLQKYTFEDGIRTASEILKGTLASAHKRFSLAMSLSSGYDSRLVFSACKDFASDVQVFSMMYRTLTPQHDDLRVPAEMSQAVGFPLEIIDAREGMSKEFEGYYQRQFTEMKNDWGSLIEARLKQIPEDRTVLKGSISEIMRCRYWDVGVYPYRVTLRDVVRLMNLGNDPLVVRSLKEWMKDALPVEKLGYKLLDFLSWENEIGNWMAIAPTYYDLSQQEFTPFSNRRFLNVMLGVDPKYRSYPNHLLEREMVKYLWPALSEFPYTPSRKVHHKRPLDGPVLNTLRWIRYLLFEEKHDRLAE